MQWIINIMTAWAKAQGYLTAGFVDRGDPAAADFITGDFVIDTAWHEFDLSTIVPEHAKAITFYLYWSSDSIGRYAKFRKHGNVNDKAIAAVTTSSAWVPIIGDLTVAVDTNRKIDYYFTAGVAQTISMTVKGWWL